MAKLLEFLDRHTARNLFRSSHLNIKTQKSVIILLVEQSYLSLMKANRLMPAT